MGKKKGELEKKLRSTISLDTLLTYLYAPLGLKETKKSLLVPTAERYEAKELVLNHQVFLFRKGKCTPKKKGVFVTLWERKEKKGPITPYTEQTNCWGALILYARAKQAGHFLLPKHLLISNGVFCSPLHPGKRGIRLYAPLEELTAKRALYTQRWQAPYFIDRALTLKAAQKKIKFILEQ